MLYYIADCKLKEISEALGYGGASLSYLSKEINRANESLRENTIDPEFKNEYFRVLKYCNI